MQGAKTMKLKGNYFYTLRENVKDEDSVSGNLLVKGGFIKKTSAGVYIFMPIGLRVFDKIENIIREEMNKTGALEMKMPSLISSDYYEKSGRTRTFGASVFSLTDRGGKNMILGPTHEELFAYAALSMVKSYKDLPFSLYQFQNKFRDEPRARYGLIRVKEFVMKDAYSFDKDYEGLDVSYKKMFDAYVNSFNRMGVKYRIVKADTGVMGGLLSEEFQALSDIGEDTIVYCSDCDYSRNIEIAEDRLVEKTGDQPLLEKELIDTGDARTIEEVSTLLKKDPENFVKTLIYKVDDKVVAVLLRGDRELSETKLSKIYQANEVTLADEETVMEVAGSHVGFVGPIGIKCEILMDKEVSQMTNFITGANQDNHHYLNVNLKDFEASKIEDVHQVKEGDICPICGGKLKFTKGIEVGNTFKLGTKYSEAMGLNYLDSDNKIKPVVMGSYGIGLGRTMAAIVEQNHDDNGIIWPECIAPFKVAIVIANTRDQAQCDLANKLYDLLSANNVEVLLDDRDERAGVKFKDMDLIGIPNRITVGRKAVENIVEFKKRNEDEVRELTVEEVVDLMK